MFLKPPPLPEEAYSVFEGKLADKPVIGNFNAALYSYPGKRHYPWALQVIIEIENAMPNGLPDGDASTKANQCEDAILKIVEESAKSVYAGHYFWDGLLNVLIFVKDPKAIHEKFNALTQEGKEPCQFGWEISKDPNWHSLQRFKG